MSKNRQRKQSYYALGRKDSENGSPVRFYKNFKFYNDYLRGYQSTKPKKRSLFSRLFIPR